MKPSCIIIASGNPGKCREISQVLNELDIKSTSLADYDDIPEPDENGASFAENAREKALYYAKSTGQWCLADDSGLVVDALDGAPGVRSARYAAERCPPDATRDIIDAANNAKLFEELANVPDNKRSARFVCHLTLADDKDQIAVEAHGTIEGQIAHDRKGDNGFGYDPLFYVPEFGCTTAQLSPLEKNRVSHRGNALRQFAIRLEEYFRKMES
ncbi:MAG: RdgB/HAM1 family non-canonical purine NTP pyrophosphatase [Phycisphaerae bacterium]|nr:RdgB/HAM1 family non-canonical purine NTP pyrophosphatase [Phycisphaerae bacterium]